jgi:hypothetical protein
LEYRGGLSSYSEADKELVRKEFSQSWGEKLEEAEETLKKIDIAIEIIEISKYVSLSRISKDYFGKSREWLYQRIKGYKVNGKQAQFTSDDKKKLSMALQDISRKAHETSLRII